MFLLDTCVLLWLADDQQRLTPKTTQAIRHAAGALFVSAISAFEIAYKSRKGKLGLPFSPEEWYTRALHVHGLAEIPIDGTLAIQAASLPLVHADPCDRFIVATALAKDLTIITADRVIAQYPGVRVVWD